MSTPNPGENFGEWSDPELEEERRAELAWRQAERRRKRLLPIVASLITIAGGFLVYALISTGRLQTIQIARPSHRPVKIDVSALRPPRVEASRPSKPRLPERAATSTEDTTRKPDVTMAPVTADEADGGTSTISAAVLSSLLRRSDGTDRDPTARTTPRTQAAPEVTRRPRRRASEHRPVEPTTTEPPVPDEQTEDPSAGGTHLIWAETTAEEARRAAEALDATRDAADSRVGDPPSSDE